MSKYKVGDKIVMVIADEIDATLVNKGYIDKAAKPLSTYTEPLEAKIRRQAAEITRLQDEYEKMLVKLDAHELYNDQHEEEYNQAFNQGAETAWELARKIYLSGEEGGYDRSEIYRLSYPEAAAKVAGWEKAKEEIKVGDVLEGIYDNEVKCIVTNLCPDNMAYLVFDDGTAGVYELDNLKKTGRHIDIDSFLKQIGGEQEWK